MSFRTERPLFDLLLFPLDDELPIRFDRKSLFEFVSTFEEAIRIPTWRLDTLSKLRRGLPLRLRLRFAKREVVIRRFARQMRSGYVLDPRCGGERSHVKAEPTLRWYLWWLLTAQPYDAYRGFTPMFGHADIGHDDEETPQSSALTDVPDTKPAAKEFTRVRLPGHTKAIIIEVPPMIANTSDSWSDANVVHRPSRPFEPLTLLFWLFVVVFAMIVAAVSVGIYCPTLLRTTG